jgi:MFS family permease
VFCYGFLGLGILNLIISFLNDKYSFLILRAISGISAAALIPSSYRLITAVFEEHELPRAFTVYSLSGALGASFGVQIGGLVELIPYGGQMSGWRWYFRITTAVMCVKQSVIYVCRLLTV